MITHNYPAIKINPFSGWQCFKLSIIISSQIQGLGFSETLKFYALRDINEAEEFLKHPLLGSRLINICNELLTLKSNDANKIFGSPDDVKLKSSMTLFSSLHNTDPVFQLVLKKFLREQKTVKLWN